MSKDPNDINSLTNNRDSIPLLPADVSNLGIANIPNQAYRFAMKQGLSLNLLFAGQGDVGKKAFLQSLLEVSIDSSSPSEYVPFATLENSNGAALEEVSLCNGQKIIELASLQVPPEAILEKFRANFVEKSMPVQVTVISVSKYGNSINQLNCWNKIVSFVDAQYEQFLEQEVSPTFRASIHDNRIHACVYFLSAVRSSISKLDLITMKKLSEKLLVIPVLTKAEILTQSEKNAAKANIKKTLLKHGIQTLLSPNILSLFKEEGGKDEFSLRSTEILDSLPFAITNNLRNGTCGVEAGKSRTYPWGVIEIEDEAYCDFSKLRALLARTLLFKIMEISRTTFYENYRMNRLINGLLCGEKSGHPFIYIGKDIDIEKCYLQAEEMLKKRYSFSQAKVDDSEFDKKREMHAKKVAEIQARISAMEQQILQARESLTASNTKIASFSMDELKAINII